MAERSINIIESSPQGKEVTPEMLANIYVNLGSMRYALNEFAEAKGAFQKALELDPSLKKRPAVRPYLEDLGLAD